MCFWGKVDGFVPRGESVNCRIGRQAYLPATRSDVYLFVSEQPFTLQSKWLSSQGFRRPGVIHLCGLLLLKRPSFWACPLLQRDAWVASVEAAEEGV